MTLVLGPIVFQDFEIPAQISFGGQQKLVTHRYMGGKRVVDAMGADDALLDWDGQFRGYNASSRARQLDLMRRSGQELRLTWDVFTYRVVIERFSADYQAPFEVPYRISCVVVADEAAPSLGRYIPTLGEGIASALTDVTGIAVDSAVLAPIVGGVQDSVRSLVVNGRLDVTSLKATALAGLRTSVGSAVDSVSTYAGGLANSLSDGLGGVTAGGDPTLMAGLVSSLAANATEAAKSQAVGSLMQNVARGLYGAGR
jgi:hypothetical protein